MASVTELRLLPIREVTRKIGCSRPHVYRLIHTAGFPLPVHLSKRARGCVTEIVSWRTRVFVPGTGVVERLLERFPLDAPSA